jgi:hypothetical protein
LDYSDHPADIVASWILVPCRWRPNSYYFGDRCDSGDSQARHRSGSVDLVPNSHKCEDNEGCPTSCNQRWNRVKYIPDLIFAAPDTVNGIRIRIHVISYPSRLEYLAAELSAYGEAKAVYDQSKEPKRSRPPTPLEQAVGARLELGDAFGTNPTTGAYQIYNVNTKKWRAIQ